MSRAERNQKKHQNIVYGLLHLIYIGAIVAFFAPYADFADKECTREISIWIIVQLTIYVLFSLKHFTTSIIFVKAIDPISMLAKVELFVLPTLYLAQCAWALYGFTIYSFPKTLINKPACRDNEKVIHLYQVSKAASILGNYYLLVILVMLPMVIGVCVATWRGRRRQQE